MTRNLQFNDPSAAALADLPKLPAGWRFQGRTIVYEGKCVDLWVSILTNISDAMAIEQNPFLQRSTPQPLSPSTGHVGEK